jgi:hypothetical protein
MSGVNRKLHLNGLGEAGFSILESLLGSVLIVAVVVGIGLSFPLMMRNQVDTAKRIQVTSAVHDRMDQLQALPFASLFLTAQSDFQFGSGCNCDGSPSYSEQNFDRDPAHFAPFTTNMSGIPIRLTTCVVKINVPSDVTIAPSPVCPGVAETGLKSITVRGEFQSGTETKYVVATTFVNSPEPPTVLPSGGGLITGKITAQENPSLGLANIPVQALDNSGALSAIAWTDHNGDYSLNHLGAGPFTVDVQLTSIDETVVTPLGGFYPAESPGATARDFIIQNSPIPIGITGARGTTVLASQNPILTPPTSISPATAGAIFSTIIGADQLASLPVTAAPGTYHVYCVAPGSTLMLEPPNYVHNSTVASSPVGPALPGDTFAVACP